MWRALAWCLIYYIFFLSIQKVEIDSYRTLGKSIGWCAFIVSIYAWLQFFGLDQFQVIRPFEEIGWGNSAPGIASTIGSGFYLANFLAICLPFCFYTMRWWQIIAIIGAILICQSDTATLGLVLTLVLLLAMQAKSSLWVKILCGVCLSVCVICVFLWPTIGKKLENRSNGRFPIWSEAIHDWKTAPIQINISPDMTPEDKIQSNMLNTRNYALTGRGPGSFDFIFQRKHPGWNDPHNIYLKILYEYGLFGLVIFVCMVGWVFWNLFYLARFDDWSRVLFCALFYCCFAGFTVPLFVVEPLRFYCVLIFSLASKAISQKI